MLLDAGADPTPQTRFFETSWSLVKDRQSLQNVPAYRRLSEAV